MVEQYGARIKVAEVPPRDSLKLTCGRAGQFIDAKNTSKGFCTTGWRRPKSERERHVNRPFAGRGNARS